MTSHDPDPAWDFEDPWTLTHPDHPLVDDHSTAVLEDATVELTLMRSPMALGDCLADLHAMVSLLANCASGSPCRWPARGSRATRGPRSPPS